MFWGDRIADEVVLRFKERGDRPIVIRDEKTASGQVHVGAMRGVALHGALAAILKERRIPHIFRYEINDFDALDSVPPYLPASYSEHLGKPLYAVPSPEREGENYAEHFGGEFARVIEATGFHPEFYYSSEAYRAGRYDECITTALERAEDIRRIYREVSGGERGSDWLPLMVVCEKCGKVATTRTLSFDGTLVSYRCDAEGSGANGCGYAGEISPFAGNAKLPWKVEWAAKFKVFDVDVEGEGKDLATKGGARDVANHIAREVFKKEPPFDAPYEFFLVGGKKMSTSKGNAATALGISELLPPHLFRTALLGKDIKKAINFDPSGDTVPVLFDQHDALAEKYWSGVEDDDARLFSVIYEGHPPEREFLMRFSQVAFSVQMPHLSLLSEAARIKGAALSELEATKLEERAEYARRWLAGYAADDFKFELKSDAVPEGARAISAAVRSALADVRAYVEVTEPLDGALLHAKLHEIRKTRNVEPGDFFGALYQSFLGKGSGPKAGWFLSVIPREFLLSRLAEVAA